MTALILRNSLRPKCFTALFSSLRLYCMHFAEEIFWNEFLVEGLGREYKIHQARAILQVSCFRTLYSAFNLMKLSNSSSRKTLHHLIHSNCDLSSRKCFRQSVEFLTMKATLIPFCCFVESCIGIRIRSPFVVESFKWIQSMFSIKIASSSLGWCINADANIQPNFRHNFLNVGCVQIEATFATTQLSKELN